MVCFVITGNLRACGIKGQVYESIHNLLALQAMKSPSVPSSPSMVLPCFFPLAGSSLEGEFSPRIRTPSLLSTFLLVSSRAFVLKQTVPVGRFSLPIAICHQHMNTQILFQSISIVRWPARGCSRAKSPQFRMCIAALWGSSPNPTNPADGS